MATWVLDDRELTAAVPQSSSARDTEKRVRHGANGGSARGIFLVEWTCHAKVDEPGAADLDNNHHDGQRNHEHGLGDGRDVSGLGRLPRQQSESLGIVPNDRRLDQRTQNA